MIYDPLPAWNCKCLWFGSLPWVGVWWLYWNGSPLLWWNQISLCRFFVILILDCWVWFVTLFRFVSCCIGEDLLDLLKWFFYKHIRCSSIFRLWLIWHAGGFWLCDFRGNGLYLDLIWSSYQGQHHLQVQLGCPWQRFYKWIVKQVLLWACRKFWFMLNRISDWNNLLCKQPFWWLIIGFFFLYFRLANFILVYDEMQSFCLERRTMAEFWIGLYVR